MTGRTGTKEWADSNVNCILGCPNRCRYCYAKAGALWRKRIDDENEWGTSYLRVNERIVKKGWRKAKGPIMFSSTHDITPEFLEPCMTVLRKLLKPGNRVLIVSKPHLECIKAICQELEPFKSQIVFRFTIGSTDNDTLAYWETRAPSFSERIASLEYAYDAGFETSVSCEPLLGDGVALYEALSPLLTNSIWFGQMTNVRSYVSIETPEDERQVRLIEEAQTDERIWELYRQLADKRFVCWKATIKKVVGLPLATEADEGVIRPGESTETPDPQQIKKIVKTIQRLQRTEQKPKAELLRVKVEIGDALTKLKRAIGHGSWTEALDELGYNKCTARRLMVLSRSWLGKGINTQGIGLTERLPLDLQKLETLGRLSSFQQFEDVSKGWPSFEKMSRSELRDAVNAVPKPGQSGQSQETDRVASSETVVDAHSESVDSTQAGEAQETVRVASSETTPQTVVDTHSESVGSTQATDSVRTLCQAASDLKSNAGDLDPKPNLGPIFVVALLHLL